MHVPILRQEKNALFIQEIVVYEDLKIFNLNKLHVKTFDNKMCAFKVQATDNTLVSIPTSQTLVSACA